MQTQDYLLLAVETGVIGLGTYFVVGQALKPGVMLLKASPARRRWLVRLCALLFGALLGLIVPWPVWFADGWGPLLGLVGGGLSPTIHSAVKKALPKSIARAASGPSVTTTMDTLDETLPEAGEGLYIGDDGYKGGE